METSKILVPRPGSKISDLRVGAFIPAAGEGRRLRPATLVTPKAAVPFCGVPLVCLAARKFHQCHMSDVVVNTHYLADQVTGAIQKDSTRNAPESQQSALPRIHFSHEASLLNTGGGLRQGCQLIPDCQQIMVHNADVVTDFALDILLNAHLDAGNLATILLIPGQGPRTVTMDRHQRIQSFRQKTAPGQFTFSGLYVFQRRLLDYLPSSPAPSIVEAMEAALLADEAVCGLPAEPHTFWNDLGTPRRYIDAHAAAYRHDWSGCSVMETIVARQKEVLASLRGQGIGLTGGSAVGNRVSIAPGSILHDCILWNDVTVPEPVALAFGIVTHGTRVTIPLSPLALPSPSIIKTLGLDRDRAKPVPLAEQGSGRRYSRLQGNQTSWIWSTYTQDRAENAYYASCADFMRRCGLRVPTVHLHQPATCELVLEDLGDRRLQNIDTEALRISILENAIEQIARLHVCAPQELKDRPTPLQLPFDEALYTWERTYFRKETLAGHFHQPESWTESIETECRNGQALLLRHPQTVVHRDFQSANIMEKNGTAVLIDFQGMRMGVGAYDLASLLFDPYVSRSATERRHLWQHYCRTIEDLGGIPPSEAVLTAAAVQRLLQALGAYGKLWLKDGREWFANYIRPGLDLLARATAGSPVTALPFRGDPSHPVDAERPVVVPRLRDSDRGSAPSKGRSSETNPCPERCLSPAMAGSDSALRRCSEPCRASVLDYPHLHQLAVQLLSECTQPQTSTDGRRSG